MNHLFPSLFGIGFGLFVADGMPVDLEKIGFGGLSALLIWWITQQLSKQIEGLRTEIRGLAEQLGKMPCERVKELEGLVSGERKG